MKLKRRAWLATVGATFTIAGCSGSDPAAPAGSTPTTDPVERTTTDPPSFELVSVDAPERVEIGTEASYTFTVKNSGGPGVFETSISIRVGKAGSWETSDSSWRREIGAGETATLESESFSWDYIGRVGVRIDEFGHVFTVQFVGQTLSFGETFQNPSGVYVQVIEPDFRDDYTWSSNGYTYEQTPSLGNTFAFVEVYALNDSGTVQWLPVLGNFAIVVEQSQYDPVVSYLSNEYEGGKVQPGIERGGWIVIEIPDDTEMSELNVVYSEQFTDGTVAANWSSGG